MTLREHAIRTVGAASHAGASLQLRARCAAVDAIVSSDDVDDAADRIGPIQRGALRAANDFDVVD